jgi:hypothetical protein
MEELKSAVKRDQERLSWERERKGEVPYWLVWRNRGDFWWVNRETLGMEVNGKGKFDL